jgi:hypothetical protein
VTNYLFTICFCLISQAPQKNLLLFTCFVTIVKLYLHKLIKCFHIPESSSYGLLLYIFTEVVLKLTFSTGRTKAFIHVSDMEQNV